MHSRPQTPNPSLSPSVSMQPSDTATAETTPARAPIRVLFLCTHNAGRSQMAEWTLRHIGRERFEVFSAGTEISEVNPLTRQVLTNAGVPMPGARSKHVDEFAGQLFDFVITVCDRANESCPVFPGDVVRIHWSFADPSAATGTEAERLRVFEDIRRQITTRLHTWVLAIKER